MNADKSTSLTTETEADPTPTLLPRSPWSSQLAYLRAMFRAKKALDRIEKEHGIL